MNDSEQKHYLCHLPRPAPFLHPSLSSATFQALLGCSKLKRASFMAAGQLFLPAILKPVACLCSYSGRLIIPYLCCHSLLCTHSAPQQVLMHSCWGKSWAAPLPQKLQLFRWKLAG